jgi:predicted nuclease of predicted toxin-antitoxin system
MRPLDFPLLADENIHPEVIRALVLDGKDVTSVLGEGLGGRSDADILQHAHAQRRAILTHDADFGGLVIAQERPFTGIIYLRPGHISAHYVLEIIGAIASTTADVEPPFLVVAERKADMVKVRIRLRGSEAQHG